MSDVLCSFNLIFHKTVACKRLHMGNAHVQSYKDNNKLKGMDINEKNIVNCFSSYYDYILFSIFSEC